MLKRLLCLLGFHNWVCKFGYSKLEVYDVIYCKYCGAIITYDRVGYIIKYKDGHIKDIHNLPVSELKE